MELRSFTDLVVYKKSRELRREISRIMRTTLPKDEKYLLLDQILRSSRSVTANIAEGYGRFYFKENIRFCRNARGSLEETKEHLLVALDEGYIDQDSLDKFLALYADCIRLLNGYMRYLQNNQLGNTSPS